jgi:hypothetical protein
LLSRTKNSTQKYASARPSTRKYCRCCINRLRLRPRPDCRRGATDRRVIVVVIVNVALKGREEQTAATTCLRPRPFPPRDPPSRFQRCQRRSQDSAGEWEEGHRLNGGRRGRIVRSRARPPPPPCDAIVQFRGSGGSNDDDDDKKQRQRRQRRQLGGSAAASLAQQWQRR